VNLLSHLDLQQVHELKSQDWPVTSIGRCIEAYSMEQMIRQEAPSVVLISVCSVEEEPFLRKIREYKNLDLDRLSDMTKVSRMYLQGIELEDFGKLPAPVYVRGFVFQFAKCLKLKPEIVANSYLARMKKLKP